MGTLLWNPIYQRDINFVVPRAMMTRVAFGWWTHHQISPLPNGIWQESLFGGYKAVVTLKSWWWPFSSRQVTIPEIVEDFYALDLDGVTKINIGVVLVNYEIDPINKQPTVVFACFPSTPDYSYYKLPPPPTNWYAPPRPDLPPP